MIAKLILSTRNIYKIIIENKIKSARKCIILSEKHEDILIQTNKEFSVKDEYVLIDNKKKIIIQFLGIVGNEDDDINIFHHLYTINWMSKTKYEKLWKEYNFIDENDNSLIRTDYNDLVVTIDPEESIDLDDGFTFNYDDVNYYLDIHIADPMSFININDLIFKKIFEELIIRINTCYISDKINSKNPIHLLPNKIIKKISLLELNDENKYRRAISFCFKINKINNKVEFNLKQTKLFSIKNETYDNYDNYLNKNLEKKTNIHNLINKLIKIMDIKYQEIKINENISHQFIEILMIFVNFYAGIYLKEKSPNMIIRVQEKFELKDKDELIDITELPEYILPFLNHGAIYKISNIYNTDNLHYSLGINNYCHVSSPMRRIIDMINHMLIYNIDIYDTKIDINYINEEIKKQNRINNSYEIIKYLKKNNKFKACILNFNKKENIINLCLVIYDKNDFKKIINVELPSICNINLKKYVELEIELYYNSINFNSDKFPFSIKIN